MIEEKSGTTMTPEQQAFFRLLENKKVRGLLEQDSFLRISDKYLLAMVLTYFERAQLEPCEYTSMNFFVALHLANDMEEETYYMLCIAACALGKHWAKLYSKFRKVCNMFWFRMDFRALVTKETCEEKMKLNPTHWAWGRDRSALYART